MRITARSVLVVAIGLGIACLAGAQTLTGTLSGRVTTSDGQGLPGVTVTATSPALQGQSTTVTAANGDFVVRGLPPGTYKVIFELQGFTTLDQEVKVSSAQTRAIAAVMNPGTFTDEVAVTARMETVSTALEAAETVEQDALEKLAIDRGLDSAVSLAAGTANTGPNGQATISGAQSFENLYTMNGIVLNDNIRNQPYDMYIEDSILESTVLTSGVSAEYGRFSGGVVNMITKSGGNDFSGSLRVGFDNDDWTGDTPLTTEKIDETNTTLEATLGGYIVRDRLWFFAAGRNRQTDSSLQTYVTQIPFTQSVDNTRLEGKLTGLFAQGHRLTATYSDWDTPVENQDFAASPAMALESIDPETKFTNTGFAVNYTGLFSDNFFIEAQYSEREATLVDDGGDDPSLEGGTVVWDYLLNGSYNAPWFCGEPCRDIVRGNQNYFLKASWFLSTEKGGSHDIVFGYDSFDDRVEVDNHQSASDYYLVTIAPTDFTTGVPLGRFLPFQFLISYSPIPETTKGSSFKTNSVFINDSWRISDRFTLNLGVRWDANDGTDSAGTTVVEDSRYSPRLGLSWDLKGDGSWVVNASAGRYVSAIVNHVADAGSAAGRPWFLQYIYGGPPVLASEVGGNRAALTQVFDWFLNAYGGPTNPALLYYAEVPGLTPEIGDDLGSPYVDEMAVGVSTRLGTKGVLRVDYVHRDYGDFYATEVVPNRWVTSEVVGNLDLGLIRNEDDLLDRKYDGLMTRAQYRIGDRLSLGGNWTWSHAIGNFDGETPGGGAIAGDVTAYREYKEARWNSPTGDLAVDQRHKVRLWAIWDAIMTKHNRLSLSLLQSYLSGSPYSAVGTIDAGPVLADVGNPGYITPPQYLSYYFSGRGEYLTDDVTSTDIAVNYSFVIPAFGGELELFVQPEVINVFNESAVSGVNSVVLTSVNDPTLQPFNALDTEPVEGVHWRKGPDFGQPQSEFSFQQPRTFRVSVGIRF